MAGFEVITEDHLCIEPYEQPWLERAGARVLRQRVEKLGPELFSALEAGDVLFIDSSHIIRPGGDLLFLYQRVLPQIKPGVYVHIHDIFSPREYPEQWLNKEKRFWNEQYLLEALMCENSSFRVVAALNMLSQEHREKLAAALPIYQREADSVTPAAFWIQRVK
jgi:hypothetical protein